LISTTQASCLPNVARNYSSGLDIFDGSLKARHRDRAAYLAGSRDPLLETVTDRLLDRLEDCKRKFPTAAILGGAAEHVLDRIAGGRAGIERVVVIDTSQDMLRRLQARAAAMSSTAAGTSAPAPEAGSSSSSTPGSSTAVHASQDSEASTSGRPWPVVEYVHMQGELLPIEPDSVDLVISSLGLHWFNDLPSIIVQCRFALHPDGLFLGSMFGGESLSELRIACSVAQMERQGGVSPIVSPLAQVRDAGNLLTRADLAMPTVDVDHFRLNYPCPTELIRHLRVMGESNGVKHRQRHLPRDTALAAAATYRAMFGEEGGVYPATYEVMYLTGWAPHPKQQQPKERGSATMSFQELADGLVKQGAVGGTAQEDSEDTDEPQQGSRSSSEAGRGPDMK